MACTGGVLPLSLGSWYWVEAGRQAPWCCICWGAQSTGPVLLGLPDPVLWTKGSISCCLSVCMSMPVAVRAASLCPAPGSGEIKSPGAHGLAAFVTAFRVLLGSLLDYPGRGNRKSESMPSCSRTGSLVLGGFTITVFSL